MDARRKHPLVSSMEMAKNIPSQRRPRTTFVTDAQAKSDAAFEVKWQADYLPQIEDDTPVIARGIVGRHAQDIHDASLRVWRDAVAWCQANSKGLTES